MRTIRDLGLPERAMTALARARVTTIDDLAGLTRRELAAIPGVGPGLIAAIRRVVPEPPAGRASGAGQQELDFPAAAPEPAPAEEEPRAAPAIPSFASLRDPRRRTAVDLLVPSPPPARSAAVPAAPRAARPAEYADLLLLGVHVLRAVAGVPGRLVRWAAREPGHCVRRLRGA